MTVRRIRLRNAIVLREIKPLAIENVARNLLRVERLKLALDPGVRNRRMLHLRLAVHVHGFACARRIMLPIAKPLLELWRLDCFVLLWIQRRVTAGPAASRVDAAALTRRAIDVDGRILAAFDFALRLLRVR